MSRNRIYYQNAVYHVFVRGNNRGMILKHKSDKMDMLVSIKKFQERRGFKMYGFVLMDNHAHFVIEVNHTHSISKIMQSILLSYSTKYRRKYEYVGHVWQGRFQSKPVTDERYMFECLNYLHSNPVKAGIVSVQCDYPYSSARFYEGLTSKGVYEYIDLSRYGDTSVVTPNVSKGCLETF